MKRTFQLFSLAIIVSLMLSAVGLPLIPVEAASTWQNVGPAGFSAGEAFIGSLVFEDGTPYVVLQDGANGNKASVMKFDAPDWVNVGPAGFSAGEVFSTSLAFDDGTPYVAFQDVANGDKVSVMKFDALVWNWVYVGSAGFSAGEVRYPSLAFHDGTPYVAFQDRSTPGYKARVMKFNALAGNWVTIGAAGFSPGRADFISFAIDQGIPYVAFQDWSTPGRRASVMKFNPLSGNWVNVGPAGFSDKEASSISLAFNSGVPYMAHNSYSETSMFEASVMKFDALAGNWVYVGPPNFSELSASTISLAFHSGTPYVAFSDSFLGYKARVMKFDAASGNWLTVGAAGFSPAMAFSTSLVFDAGIPYVSYTDTANGDKASVMKYAVVDLTAPTITSIVRANLNPASAARVKFIVTFSEAVMGITADDFAVYPTGNVVGAAIQNVSGSGSTRTVTVSTGNGDGTLRLDMPGSATITDLAGNVLSNLPFETGEAYTVLALKRKSTDTTGVFRPSNGLLYLKNGNDTGIADMALNYGLPGDYPVVGDWDGNGTVTIGIYRNGYFYLRNENTIGFAEVVFPFGSPVDQPIAGDWDGDDVDTIGVYRPSNGQFFLRDSNTQGPAEMIFYLGNPGDVGIAGDWDGDGLDTTGVFRPSNGLLYLKNKNETGFADAALNYGLPGDRPVTGDWNGDGVDTIGVYRSGLFYLRNSNTIGFAEIIFGLGNPGDMPIAGNWDGLP